MEPLESRTLLSATPTDDSFRLAIFADSVEEAIPAEVGVASDDSTQSLFTVDGSGEVYLDASSGQKLGDFFDIWQNNAGLAGNRADAVLSEDQLLGNIEDGTNTVQMFVNGQVSTEFDEYVVQDGDEIVLVYGDNPILSINTNYGPIVVELFADDTPITVENFLNYVNDGDYINSFFHRSAKLQTGEDFIVQGGGFTTNSTTFTDTDQFTDVASNGQIQNEPGIHNVRGTIAMAKLGGQPNSATNQFFINNNDNRSILDAQNGGFTVFGQVLDMTTADEIHALPITAASSIDSTISSSDASLYSTLPLGTGNELVVVESVAGQGEISGTKYLDEDGNGTYDSGEALLPGVTIYLDDNDNGLLDSGETWTLTGTDGSYRFQVEAGTHVVRSEVTPGRVGTEPVAPDSYTVTVEIGRETADLDFGENLLPPSSIDLLAASDTGSADDDDLTQKNNANQEATLQFLVAGVTPGATVQLYADGTLIGSAVATTDEVTITTGGTHTLSDGVRSITAVQTLGGTSALSDALQITVDTTAPAGLTNQAPDTAQVGVVYSFDAESPDEGSVSYSLTDAPTGMTIDAATGEIAWTPNVDQAVPQSFDIAITDPAGNTTSQNVEVTVLGVIPAYPDNYDVNEDTTLTVNAADGVLGNDDTTSGTLSVATIDLPSHGNLTLSSDGSFVYTPTANFSGTDSFTYQATNTTGDESNVAKVTITVNPVNDVPVGVADVYDTVVEDTTFTVTAAEGVLANDGDDDEGDALTVAIVDQAAHGTLTLNSDGSFSYAPDADYNGDDSFTYKINDGTDDSAPVTVSLTTAAVNDAPATLTDTYSMDEDGTLTVLAADGVLANDTDAEGDSFTAAIASQPANGSVSLADDGSFVYTPDVDFFGTDTFTYRATDGSALSDATTVAITISPIADPPTAVDDTFTAPNDGTPVLIDVLANDSDPDGSETLTITAVTQGSAGGTVTIENNQLRYTAKEGAVGQETVTYTITDSDGLTDTATLTVSVVDASDNTLSGFVYVDTDGDGTRDSGEIGVPGVLITLTGTDNFGNAVTRTALTSLDGSYAFEELTSGTYQLQERQPTALADGTDSSAVSGAVVGDDVISSLEISDSAVFAGNNFGETGLLPQYLSIRMFLASAPPMDEFLRDTVAQAEALAGHDDLAEAIRNGDSTYDDGSNHSPVAASDTYSASEDTTLSIVASAGVLANDTDADGDSLSATLVTDVSHGSLTFSADGSFSYTPDSDFHGTDSFTYKANDGTIDSETATVTIDVNAIPVAASDSYSATEDQLLTVNATDGVLANDSDADGDTLTVTATVQPAHGTLALSSNGSFTYTPDADFEGTDTFKYKANDGFDDSAEATVTITVSPVNDAPSAVNDSFDVEMDTVLTVPATQSVLVNDTDADGDTLTAAIVTQPAHGTVSFNADGSFIYTPETGYHGDDTFTYEANDGTIDSTPATVTINVNAIPVADDDAYSVNEDTVLPVDAAGGVLNNDSDADSDTLTVTVVSQPSHGTVTLDPDGSFSYTPEADFYGTDTFTYKANDGAHDSLAATVTLTVNPVNDLSMLTADLYSVPVNGHLSVDATNGVLSNDSDPDGDGMTAAIVTQPAHGTITLNDDGSFDYTPAADYHGTDTFTYEVNDGTGDSAAATVTIHVNTPTGTIDDAYSTVQNAPLAVDLATGVAANDADVDGDSFTVAVVAQPTHGTLSLNPNGSFTYTPEANFYGTDSFTYQADDGFADSSVATVTIDVNALPVAAHDSYSVDEDTTLTVVVADGVLKNDTDADGDTLTVTVAQQPSHGTLTLAADGSFTYTPDADFHGVDGFAYIANDGTGNSDEATVTITVNTVPEAPVAVDDVYSVIPNGTLNVSDANGLLINDTDGDGDSLTATAVDLPSNGTLTLGANGSFTYEPNASFHGTDTFTYEVNDGTSDSAPATVTIHVNTVPNAVSDSYSVDEDGTLTVVSAADSVLKNDADAESDPMTATVVLQPSHGTLTLNSDGTFTYTPDTDFSGDDGFTYVANDGFGDSAEATVAITVNPVNDAPVANDDSYSVPVNGELTVQIPGVADNDEDVDGDSLTVVEVTGPSHGSLTLNADGSFTYVPDTDFHGTDTFTYKVNDTTIDSATATVTIDVNTLANAVDDPYSVAEDGTLTVDAAAGVLNNDSDVDGDTLTVTLVTDTTHGTLTLAADGSFEYEPEADYHGTDTFTYVVNDTFGNSAEATVTITVDPVNDAPVVVDDAYPVLPDAALNLNATSGVLANDSDLDGDSLEVTLVTGPAHGTLLISDDGSFSYTPQNGYEGTDSFTYTVNDGTVDSLTATVTLNVDTQAALADQAFADEQDWT